MTKLTIEFDTLSDLLAKTTNNPLAEEVIPSFLRDLIERGGEVTVTLDDERFRLVLDKGAFRIAAPQK